MKVAHPRMATVKHRVRESKDEANILLRASMADHISNDSDMFVIFLGINHVSCVAYFE